MKIRPFFESSEHENCTKCGLSKKCVTPFMKCSGNGAENILILAEAPGKQEDVQGVQLIGEAGQFLRKELEHLGYDLDEDFYKTNAIICRPPNNKTPTKTQIACCKRNVLNTIKEKKPKAVFVLGNVALESLIGEYISKCSITTFSGLQIPLIAHDCWVFPLFHPSFLIRNKHDKNMLSYFRRTLKDALINCEDLKRPSETERIKNVHSIMKNDMCLLTDCAEVVDFIETVINAGTPAAFDYETTGIYPYNKGHKIVSASIATDDVCFAFPLQHKHWSKSERKAVIHTFKKFLKSDVFKIAHNSNFECMWSHNIFGIVPKNLSWCTLVTQHMVDNRSGLTGLKLQAFLRWGIVDYDKTSKLYIKAVNGTEFNKMEEMPLSELLLYNCIDSALTLELYYEQVDTHISQWAQSFFNDGILCFREMSQNGLYIDSEHYKKVNVELTQEIENIEGEIQESQEVLRYLRISGSKELNLGSPKQLQALLFDKECGIGLKSIKKTKTGNSVDAATLEMLPHWIPNKIIEMRKLVKIRDTYISQMSRCVFNDGKIHPNFTLHIARTFRSSSSEPNLQNLPKRDKKAMSMIRKGIIPSPGCCLIEGDFSGAEVITAAGYNKDPNLQKYLLDPSTDMHRDMAQDLYLLSPEQVTKMIRKKAKPATFGFFYGNWWKAMGPLMYHANIDEVLADGTPMREHLKSVGLGTEAKFTKNVEKVEKLFWGERFNVYYNWRIQKNKEYIEKGFIDTYLGFRFGGYMDSKQVSNYPIQGSSFHLLLFACIELQEWLRENNMKTKIVGEIHDSVILDSPKEENDCVIKEFKDITASLHEVFDFLEVPMNADFEISDLRENGGNLAEMMDYK